MAAQNDFEIKKLLDRISSDLKQASKESHITTTDEYDFLKPVCEEIEPPVKESDLPEK